MSLAWAILPETFQPKIITPVEKISLLQYKTAHFRAQGMC
ncbi:protein yadK [Escherichia coli DEC2E]|nr:protein yadK [Escherichia coli DEC2E]